MIMTWMALPPAIGLTTWWLWQRWPDAQRPRFLRRRWPKAYLQGITYLLTDKPDEALSLLIKTLRIDRNTFDTHLALGTLFRRRGEFERAIHLHEQLSTEVTLTKSQRMQATAALAEDYFKCGLIEQAERLFLNVCDVADEHALVLTAMRSLIELYEQERNWSAAITLSQRFTRYTGIPRDIELSHYYCELAQRALDADENTRAEQALRRAMNLHPAGARACILFADMLRWRGDTARAIGYYQQVFSRDADFSSEIIYALQECYMQHRNENDFLQFLQNLLREYPRASLAGLIARLIQQRQGETPAIEFLKNYLQQHPSLKGLIHLFELRFHQGNEYERRELLLLQSLLTQLIVHKPNYRCHHCGFSGKQLHWRCPSCHRWNSVKPILGLEGDG